MTSNIPAINTYPRSYYAASAADSMVSRPALTDATETDVCIVGAGFTGLYTALRLTEAGKRVVILESSRVGWGASGRNGGQAILGFSCDMPPLEAQLCYEEAREIWNLMRASATEIRQRIAQQQGRIPAKQPHLRHRIIFHNCHEPLVVVLGGPPEGMHPEIERE